MKKNILLPVIGKLEKMIINEVNFKNHHNGIREFGETQVKIHSNYNLAIKEDTYDEYMAAIELIVEGSEKSTGEQSFIASCKLSGFYRSDESFEEFIDDILDIVRMRSMYQIYSIARMEVQSILRKSGIMVKDFEFEQDDVIEAAIECCSYSRSKIPKKKTSKKKTSKKKTSKKAAG